MKEPERLLGGGATDFERTLLLAVQDERPSPELTARMERALGIAVGAGLTALTQTSAAQAATQTATSSGASLAAKPLVAEAVGGKLLGAKLGASAATGLAVKAGVGVVIGTGLVVSAVSLMPGASSERASESPAPAASVARAPESDVAALPESALDSASAPALREEIVLLDAARAALARGDAAGTRSALERYRAQFPRGALLREARVLWARAGAGPWQTGDRASASGTEGAPRH